MPNTASAKKRLRQGVKRHQRNRSEKRTLSTFLKRVTDALASGDQAKAQEDYRVASKKLDQASAKGVIHANAAARLKSRYSKRLKAAK
ncbi:MAG: 30S ribosomal protein S20 [Pirellulales bacterium]